MHRWLARGVVLAAWGLLALAFAALDAFVAPPAALAAACPGPDTYGYTCGTVSKSFVSGTTDTGNHTDDSPTTTISLPFSFKLYGTSYTTANVASNGNLQFGSTNTSFLNTALPNSSFNQTLFVYWDDLLTANAGFGIFTAITGSAPNRTFVVEWRTQNVDLAGAESFEIQLEETTNNVYFVYGASTGTGANGGSATSGIQQATGTSSFLQYSFNQGVLTSGTAVRYSPPPDLAVTKTGPAAALAGTDLTYTVTAINNGPVSAVNVTVSDILPATTTFISQSQPSGPTFSCTTPAAGANGTISCTIAAFPVATPAALVFVAHVSPSAASGGTISNTAVIASGSAVDPVPGNNSATTSATVSTQANVRVMKTAPSTVAAGASFVYTLTVVNPGLSDAQNVQVVDTLPPGVSFVSLGFGAGAPPTACATGTTITCAIPTLPLGRIDTIFLNVQTAPSLPSGTTLTNTATFTSDTADPDPTNNSATTTTAVTAQADLRVTKTAPASAPTGSNVTYTVVVVNNGPSDSHNVQLTDNVPPNTTFVSESEPAGPVFTCTNPPAGGTGATSCHMNTLSGGASATFRLVVQVAAGTAPGTSITNAATITSDTPDPNAANNTATATSFVPAADLAVTKTGNPSTVQQGQSITYTLTVTNNGPSAAQNVTLADTVPTNTTFVSETQTGGPVFSCSAPSVGSSGTVSCSAGALANGASAAFQIVVRVNNATPNGATITNTANVSDALPDQVPGNNAASATTTVNPPPPTPTPFPRPNVGVQVAPSAGTLRTTITARDAACTGGNNQLQSIQVTRLTNATLDVATSPVTTVSTTPTTVSLPTHPASVQLTVHRVTPGQAATVELTVTDGCGSWPTFVGGGPSAF